MKDYLISAIPVVVIVIVAALVCGFKDMLKDKKHQKTYQNMLNDREAMSDQEFCRLAGLDASDVELVHSLRASFSRFRSVSADMIYPDDSFFEHFGMPWDDTLAMFLHAEGILYKHDYWFPNDEINGFSDLVPLVKRMNKETEQVAASDR